ncbi:class I SAM-dependent methyltransferase [Enterovibrio norvegicus]|uniref:class I SAM-dependent methyltransferase n=1 Tax=Enterovibrio norvegicus TaxID=188144 RepID=UPI000C863FB7|nr:class I SAM-dependent methyltransferase [Enterovibrio norvegicus]PMN70336.1 methyltransferase type 12 [Enterovibrio norvegicus]
MDYLTVNKNAWDKRVDTHVKSDFYDVDGFLNGKSSLNDIEREQVGDVNDKHLLHLQCHFGQDTLSWARLGARVTGVDLSSEAIEKANELANTLKLDAQFINDDVYRFGDNNTTEFDIVFTSYGVLCWLPDVDRWAQTIAKALKVGGEFHMVEFHPAIDLVFGYNYFSTVEPSVELEGTYTDGQSEEKNQTMQWSHSLGEVITALNKAGIALDAFQEYPYSPYNCFNDMEEVEGKGYQLRHQGHAIPLLYSIKGRRVK